MEFVKPKPEQKDPTMKPTHRSRTQSCPPDVTRLVAGLIAFTGTTLAAEDATASAAALEPGPDKEPRFQISADYFNYRTEYSSDAGQPGGLLTGTDGVQSGDLYGGTVGVRLGKREGSGEDTAYNWLDFSYRTGPLEDAANYSGGWGSAESRLETDLTEFEARYRLSLSKFYTAFGFAYQQWDSEETWLYSTGDRYTSEYEIETYLGTLAFGGGWVWELGKGFDLGIRLELGLGFGYRTATAYLDDDGFLGSVTGQGVVFFQYRPVGRPFGTVFIEGGGKGVFYYTGEDQLYEYEFLYGPLARAGIRFDF